MTSLLGLGSQDEGGERVKKNTRISLWHLRKHEMEIYEIASLLWQTEKVDLLVYYARLRYNFIHLPRTQTMLTKRFKSMQYKKR